MVIRLLVLFALACLSAAKVSEARDVDDTHKGSFPVGDPGSVRQLLATGKDSCSDIIDSIDFFSRDTLNKGSETITASSAECCKMCNEHPDCKSWTRIKTTSTFNKEGECYLRDSVPVGRKCVTCESGLSKPIDGEDAGTDTDTGTDTGADEDMDAGTSTDTGTDEDADADVLDACAKRGRTAAKTAVIGACAILTRKCPVKVKVAGVRSAVLPQATAALDDVIERTCDILFEDACIRESFDIASGGNDDCASIILNGPDDRAEVSECPDFSAAVDIFKSVLEKVCIG